MGGLGSHNHEIVVLDTEAGHVPALGNTAVDYLVLAGTVADLVLTGTVADSEA